MRRATKKLLKEGKKLLWSSAYMQLYIYLNALLILELNDGTLYVIKIKYNVHIKKN